MHPNNKEQQINEELISWLDSLYRSFKLEIYNTEIEECRSFLSTCKLLINENNSLQKLIEGGLLQDKSQLLPEQQRLLKVIRQMLILIRDNKVLMEEHEKTFTTLTVFAMFP